MKKVYDYLDYRNLLADWYQYRKDNGGFSYQAWADQAGFGAKDFLYRVIQGDRNLSADGAQKVAQSINLNLAESDFFLNLVKFNQADNREEREKYWNEIELIYKQRQYTNPAVKLNYFKYRLGSQWYHIAILSMIRKGKFDGNCKSLAERLVPELTEAQVRKSLELLEDLKLIQKNADDSYSCLQCEPEIEITLESLTKTQYLSECYNTALRSLDVFKEDERWINTNTFCLSPSAYTKIKDKIHALQTELQALALESSDQENSERPYWLNVNLIPLARKES